MGGTMCLVIARYRPNSFPRKAYGAASGASVAVDAGRVNKRSPPRTRDYRCLHCVFQSMHVLLLRTPHNDTLLLFPKLLCMYHGFVSTYFVFCAHPNRDTAVSPIMCAYVPLLLPTSHNITAVFLNYMHQGFVSLRMFCFLRAP